MEETVADNGGRRDGADEGKEGAARPKWRRRVAGATQAEGKRRRKPVRGR